MGFLLPIIGFAVGGPWGALIGGLLQDIFFAPEGPKGPRLNELNVQHSTVGAPIPIVYGTAALAGNVIWSGGLIETKHEDEQGGFLGVGGVTTTSYTYSVDVAIGICEGEINGIRRIWADADLIYDASDDETLIGRYGEFGTEEFLENFLAFLLGLRAASAQLNFELYLGTEDQLPDPTIQAYENVGYVTNVVPAYRGLAYIVLNDFQLEKYGNRIPNFRFEVVGSGDPVECGIYSAGVLYPWEFEFDALTRDPRNTSNQHLYRYTEGLGGEPDTFLPTALADMETAVGRPFLIDAALGESYGDNLYIHGWSFSTTPNNTRPCDALPANADGVVVQISLNSVRVIERYECPGLGLASLVGANMCEALGNVGVGHIIWLNAGQLSGMYVRVESGTTPEDAFGLVSVPDNEIVAPTCVDPPPGQNYRIVDRQLAVKRSIQPPDTYLLTWTQVAGTFHALQTYHETAPFGIVDRYPVGPVLISTDPLYNDQDAWEAAYAAALADGEPIAPGLVYGVDYPQSQSYAFKSECEAITVDCVPMATIVADICRRAGLRTDTATQIDVSDLTTCVPGYIIGRQMSARDALGPLRMYGLWDACESDALLKFVERGHAIVETLTADDLGAHENGSQAPTAVEVSRVQEKDLPRRLRVHFANFLHDHEVSEQSASRLATEAIDEVDVDMPISMEPDTAAQLADIMLYETWFGRSTFRFSLDNNRLALEPTDCVEIPVDGETRRVRIVSVDYSIGGILKIDAVADDDGAYVSTKVATPSAPSGGVPGGPGSGPICPSGLVLLDIPRLNNAHIDAGYYVAIYGTCDSWACAELFRSSDGGVTYGRVARTDVEATVGEIDDITGPPTDATLPGDSPPYDTTSSISVTLFDGELSSITDAQIDAGQNMAAVGSDGSWVIIQYKTATLDTGDTWTLTDIIWGLNDTQHLLGTTGVGDTFVLLSGPGILRVAESADNIGVSKLFKPVTCGQAIDDVDPISFTTWGLSYLRLCPSTVISATVTDPPDDADDGDAYLLPNDTSLSGVWATHGGQIAKWSDETDSWVYCTPAPGTIIHIGADTSEGGEDVISGGDGTYTPSPWAPTDATYLTEQDETARLPNSLRLIPGTNVTFATDTGNTLEISADVAALEFQDEGIDVGAVSTVNFVGDGVTSTLDSSGVLEVNIPGGATTGGGGACLVAESIVSGGPVTSFGVSGLDLIADERYFVEIEILSVSGVPSLSMTYNADTTAANYDVQVAEAGGTGFGAARANNAILLSLVASDTTSIDGWIRINVDNKPRFIYEYSSGDTTGVKRGQGSHTWRTASTNVTGITLTSDVASAIGNGSRIRVYLQCGGGGDTGGGPIALDDLTDVTIDTTLAEGDILEYQGTAGWVNVPGPSVTGGSGLVFVTSTTVTGSPTTTVTISGLDLDAAEAYFIVIEGKEGGSSPSGISMFYNGDTTATNYDVQVGVFFGGSSSAARTNNAQLLAYGSTSSTVSFTGWLRRTATGLPRLLGQYIRNEMTSLDILQVGHSWRTSANVTSIAFTASVANNLGVGWKAWIWRLTT